MDANTISAIGTMLSAVGTIAAVVVSVIIYRGQSTLSASIAERQSEISLHIHESDKLLSQRQLLLPLWQYMSSLSNVNPRNPVTPDILKNVNTLELVALSCEGGMVDPAVIKRTFGPLYLALYDQVSVVPEVPGLGKSGLDLLRENPAAMAFYEELRREHMSRGKLSR